jgi:ferredoxin, 2Fe-2S
MITIKFIASNLSPEKAITEIQCKPGISLMQAAVNAQMAGIEADCGGLLSCATCHVFVAEPWASQLPPPQSDEISLLDFTATARKQNSRLSCQVMLTPLLDGLSIELPQSQH